MSVAYTRTMTAIDGHVLRLRVDQPTRGPTVELDYGDTDRDDMTPLDYIAGSDHVPWRGVTRRVLLCELC